MKIKIKRRIRNKKKRKKKKNIIGINLTKVMAKVLKLNPHSINQHIQKKKVKKKVLGQKKKSLKLNREKSHQNKVIKL